MGVLGLRFFRSLAPSMVAFLLICGAAGCGTSSSTSVVSPSPSKCTTSVTNSPPELPAAGGGGTITVTAERECVWSARAEASWITLRGTSGQGTASVNYTVAANPAGTPRRGQVVVSEQTIDIVAGSRGLPLHGRAVADGPRCRGVHREHQADVVRRGRGADEIRIAVTADGNCAWTSTSTVPWVTIAEGATGSGKGKVRLLVKANTRGERSVTPTIAGQAFKLRQLGSS